MHILKVAFVAEPADDSLIAWVFTFSFTSPTRLTITVLLYIYMRQLATASGSVAIRHLSDRQVPAS